jgi:hypothetical protein
MSVQYAIGPYLLLGLVLCRRPDLVSQTRPRLSRLEVASYYSLKPDNMDVSRTHVRPTTRSASRRISMQMSTQPLRAFPAIHTHVRIDQDIS